MSPALHISCDIHPWIAANVLGQMMMGSSRIINRICVHSTTTITITTTTTTTMYVQMTNCGSPICMIEHQRGMDGWMECINGRMGVELQFFFTTGGTTTTTTSHNDIAVSHYHANNGQTVCASVCKEWMGWDAVTFVGALRQIVVVWQEPATIIHEPKFNCCSSCCSSSTSTTSSSSYKTMAASIK